MKYVLKRIIIGVLLFLIIGFLKSKNVFAYSTHYYLDLQKCGDLGGNMYCTDNIVRTPMDSTFSVPKNTIIKDVLVDYANVNLNNNTNQVHYYKFEKYYEAQFIPSDLTNCPNINDNSSTLYKTADFFNAKNYRFLACEYVDSNNQSHDCLDKIYTDNSNLLHYRNFVSDDQWADVTGAKGYWSADGEWINIGGFNYAKTFYFAVSPNDDIKSISIKMGGFGNYIGSYDGLYSYRASDNWSNYYLDYPLINDCTFSKTSTIQFTRTSWYTNTGFTFNSYVTNPALVTESYLTPIDSTELESEISDITGSEDLQKDLALQDRLIGYDQQSLSSDGDDLISGIAGSLDDQLGTAPSLFYDFLALPVNLLAENSNQSLYSDVGGAVYCNHYASQYLSGTYSSIYGEVNLTIPFTHNQLKLDCFNSNVLSPYNKHFGSFYNQDSEKGLDRTLRPIWHVILSGILSYHVIVAYFKLIKEIYDPDDMSIEVLDL